MDAVHDMATTAGQDAAIASAMRSAGRAARRTKVEAFKAMMADHYGPCGARACPEAAQGTQQTLRMTLQSTPYAVGLARQATRDTLATWRLACLEETAVLLVSELVTNAVRHARGSRAIALKLQTAETWLHIEVHDGDPRWPQPRTPAGFDDSGFGFVLVDAMARKWGVRDTATGKAVWADLDVRPGDPYHEG